MLTIKTKSQCSQWRLNPLLTMETPSHEHPIYLGNVGAGVLNNKNTSMLHITQTAWSVSTLTKSFGDRDIHKFNSWLTSHTSCMPYVFVLQWRPTFFSFIPLAVLAVISCVCSNAGWPLHRKFPKKVRQRARQTSLLVTSSSLPPRRCKVQKRRTAQNSR